jgi:CRISPR-associated protein Cmr5
MVQKRAEFALERVLALKGDREKFKSLVNGAPSMILQNGFGQSMAFWIAKGTKEGQIKDQDKHVLLFDMVMQWLSLKHGDINNMYMESRERRGLLEELAKMDQCRYLAAQNEALSLLEWVKRFANADLS